MHSGKLHERMRALLAEERELVVEFLFHLDEFDRRRDYERFGRASVWEYCRESLGMCESTAFRRIKAMQLIRRFPEIAERLRDGRISMSALMLLKDALAAENVTALLDRAAGKSKKEVQKLAAVMNAPIVPVSDIRTLPPPQAVELAPDLVDLRMATSGSPDAGGGSDGRAAGSGELPCVAAGQAVLVLGAAKVEEVRPVSANQSLMTVTIDREFEEDLDELRIALGHAVPDGDLAGLLRYCVKKELDRVRKRNGVVPLREEEKSPAIGQRANPVGSDAPIPNPKVPDGATKPLPGDAGWSVTARTAQLRRGLPAWLRRLVWKRDGGRCQYRLKNGKACGSRRRCEIDHIVPVARGGRSTPENLRVACRAHNLQAARDVFGDALVDRFAKRNRSADGRSGAAPSSGKAARDGPREE